MSYQSRTKSLIGASGVELLASKSVLVVGLGGVGGYAFETVLRSGIGKIAVCDGDVFADSNLNRQLLSQVNNIGQSKVSAALLRAKTINPEVEVDVFDIRFDENTCDIILGQKYDYIIDCIDSVKDKVLLIKKANELKVPCISALGTANRLDIDFVVTDIYMTQNDGLARAVRKQLKQLGVVKHKVVYSKQPPSVVSATLGSIVFSPAVCGITVGREVIMDLLKERTNEF